MRGGEGKESGDGGSFPWHRRFVLTLPSYSCTMLQHSFFRDRFGGGISRLLNYQKAY